MLGRMTDSTHAEAGEVGQRLDVLLTRDDPSNSDSWRLQSLCTGPCDEHVTVVKVLYELNSTH